MTEADSDETALVPQHPADLQTRSWTLAMKPAAALALVSGAKGMVARTVDEEDAKCRLEHDGTFFVEALGEGELQVWRRPTRDWTYKTAGALQPVPYPDVLHLRAERTTAGSTVTATWRPHPATLKSFRFDIGMALLTVAAFSALSLLGPLPWAVWLIVPFGFAFAFFRRHRARPGRESLLSVVHEALAAHDLAEAGATPSAFRRRSLPSGES
ncbi:MAG: hypothetical protein AAF721_06035 [Myxococcota bacterium]